MSRCLSGIIVVVVFGMLLSCTVPPPNVSEISCESVARHWIGEVAPNPAGVSTEVLEISNLEESSRVTDEFENALECTGNAKFADQTWYHVVLGYFKDADGEHWYEIKAIYEIPEPTASESLQDPTRTVVQRAAATPAPTPDTFLSLECLALTSLIIKMTESEADPFIEISMVEKIFHDNNEMVCKGLVKQNSGYQDSLRFYQDKSGEYGYGPLGIPDQTCAFLVASVIRISQESEQASVLKIYDPEELGRTDSRLDCIGTSRMSDGDYSIEFYIEEDVDGDLWVFYENFPISTGQVSPTPTPQPVAPAVPTSTPDPYVASSNGLRLLEWKAYEDVDLGWTNISGVIENPSKTYRSESGDACLFFDLYDSAGYFLGDEQIYISESIPPEQKLKFDELLTIYPFSELEFKAFKDCWD